MAKVWQRYGKGMPEIASSGQTAAIPLQSRNHWLHPAPARGIRADLMPCN